MMTRTTFLLALTCVLLLAALACGISFGGGMDEQAELQLTVEAIKNSQSSSNIQNPPVQQPHPAQQNQPAQQNAAAQQEVVDPAASEAEDDGIPCNSSKFVSETIPDFTVFQPGAVFQKSWTLRNGGDCDWTEDYVLVFEEGDRLNGESSIRVNTVIEPNETITFTINLKAPTAAGDYVGVWRLKAADGEKLGKYWVKIKVQEPAPDFAVTSVSTNLKANYSANCPASIDVEIYIKTNGKGKVIYQPETSDLGKAPEDTLTFDSAGTKTESYTWTINSSGNYWLKVYIKQPNNQTFGPYNLKLTCK